MFLTCLLLLHHTLFRLFALIWSGSCTHQNVATSFDLQILNIPCQTMVYAAFHSYWPSLSLTEVLLLSLIFSKSLFVPCYHLSYPMLQTCLRFTLVLFLDFHLIYLLCFSFTYQQSLPNSGNDQIVIIIRDSCTETSDMM